MVVRDTCNVVILVRIRMGALGKDRFPPKAKSETGEYNALMSYTVLERETGVNNEKV